MASAQQTERRPPRGRRTAGRRPAQASPPAPAALEHGPGEAVPPPPSVAAVALNRMAFGPRPGDLDTFNALGSTDEERLTAYVEEQLFPDSINDSDLESRLAAAGLVTLNMSVEQLWATYVRGSGNRYRPFYEVRNAAFLRALYSRRQLLEVLASFWHNHFSTYGRDYWVAPVFPHYDRVAIRAHVFGNFREMLEAVATSTAMLYYLDNYTSSNAGPNENFSRELFELHTMGAESYLGVMQQHQVPLDPEGRPIGYVDADVFESTRCFTGWSVNNSDSTGNTGAFLYRPDWHDRFQKTVLGVFIPQDQPDLEDGRDVLDALAHHPGTARHIARKLCRRLIGDDPPQQVVDAAAATFEEYADAPSQLRRVVRAILMSDAFRTTWGDKVKSPFELAASALRATGADFHFAYDHSDTNSFFWRFADAGQPLFEWPAPDGYPDSRDAWQSASSRIMSWRFANWLIDFRDSSDAFYADILGQTPPSVRSANQLVDYWGSRVLGYPLPAGERQEIVEFMAQGHNPDVALPVDGDQDTRDRVRSMVGLILMSPSFMWR